MWNYDEAFAGRVLWTVLGKAVTPRVQPLRPALIGPYTPLPPRFGAKEDAEDNSLVHDWLGSLFNGVERSVQARMRFSSDTLRCSTGWFVRGGVFSRGGGG